MGVSGTTRRRRIRFATGRRKTEQLLFEFQRDPQCCGQFDARILLESIRCSLVLRHSPQVCIQREASEVKLQVSGPASFRFKNVSVDVAEKNRSNGVANRVNQFCSPLGQAFL